MRVLLVDDDGEVAEYVRRELEEESFDVVVAHDGASGLRLAETSAFDIIVLDVMMPFMDGLQVTRSLRGQNILTPILLLTARDAPEEIARPVYTAPGVVALIWAVVPALLFQAEIVPLRLANMKLAGPVPTTNAEVFVAANVLNT